MGRLIPVVLALVLLNALTYASTSPDSGVVVIGVDQPEEPIPALDQGGNVTVGPGSGATVAQGVSPAVRPGRYGFSVVAGGSESIRRRYNRRRNMRRRGGHSRRTHGVIGYSPEAEAEAGAADETMLRDDVAVVLEVRRRHKGRHLHGDRKSYKKARKAMRRRSKHHRRMEVDREGFNDSQPMSSWHHGQHANGSHRGHHHHHGALNGSHNETHDTHHHHHHHGALNGSHNETHDTHHHHHHHGALNGSHHETHDTHHDDHHHHHHHGMHDGSRRSRRRYHRKRFRPVVSWEARQPIHANAGGAATEGAGLKETTDAPQVTPKKPEDEMSVSADLNENMEAQQENQNKHVDELMVAPVNKL